MQWFQGGVIHKISAEISFLAFSKESNTWLYKSNNKKSSYFLNLLLAQCNEIIYCYFSNLITLISSFVNASFLLIAIIIYLKSYFIIFALLITLVLIFSANLLNKYFKKNANIINRKIHF